MAPITERLRMTEARITTGPSWLRVLLPGAGLAACLLWAYAPTFAAMSHRWRTEAQYSHGYLVPLLAVVILWSRRRVAPAAAALPSWWGLALLGLAGLVRLIGAYWYLDWLDGASLMPALLGVALLLGGSQAVRWCWPAVVYLVFMLPLPFRVEVALSEPLQWLAVQMSTYALQTLGQPAYAEGNIIKIGDLTLGVLEACNGLGMLMTFFALATAMALLIERDKWIKIVLFWSAIPIAVLSNVIRIVFTAFLFRLIGSEAGQAFSHDMAGWLMMPIALGLLWLELCLLDRLLIEVKRPGPVPVPPDDSTKTRRGEARKVKDDRPAVPAQAA
jgi:exosortase